MMLVPLIRLLAREREDRKRYIENHLPKRFVDQCDARIDKLIDTLIGEAEYAKAEGYEYMMVTRAEADELIAKAIATLKGDSIT